MVTAVIHFVLAAALWIVFMGWIVHLWSIFDAAIWKGRRQLSTGFDVVRK